MTTFSRFIAVSACIAVITLAGCATIDLGPDTGVPLARMPGGGSPEAASAVTSADEPPDMPAQTMPVSPGASTLEPLPDEGASDSAASSASGSAASGADGNIAAPGTAPVPPVAGAPLVTLTAHADGPSAVPPTPSRATAQIDLIYDASTRLLRWKAVWTALPGPITAIRFYGPAAQGQQGPATLIWPGPFGPRYEGRATLTPQQSTDLMGGLWYVNIATVNYPGGEIRGQLRVVY